MPFGDQVEPMYGYRRWEHGTETIGPRPSVGVIDGLAQRHGLMAICHAAVIGEDGVGLLIVGEGGRGKSTLALAAIGAGMDYLGDDYCLVDPQPPYRAYRLFNTAKLQVNARVQPDWIVDIEHEIEVG